jgi:hypothetical protein
MSKFTDALAEYLSAREAHESAVQTRVWPSREVADETRENADRRLAQAGDVLEREMRDMMREEVQAINRRTALLPFASSQIPFPGEP